MEKLKIKEKVGYSAGDFAGNLIWMMVVFFLPKFYTDTFVIPATAAGTLFLIVRLFDAINDPLMGIIADRTNTKWGKFRPYVLWFSVPFGIAGFAMFFTPDLDISGRIVYAYITYILMMVIYTVITIPFNALSGVITINADERTSLNSYRFVAAYTAGIVIQGLTLPMVARLGNGNDALGYKLTIGVYALFAIALFMISFFSTRERVQPDPDINTNIKSDLSDLIKNKSWIILFLVSLLLLVYIFLRSGAILYYFEYVLNRKELASSFMVTGTLAVIAGVILTKPLNRIISRKKLFILSMAIIALSCIGFYYTDPGQIVLIFVLQIIFSLASGPTMPLLWTMYADTADYSEYKTGRRATGLVFSASTFAMKFGGAIGGALVLWMLSWFRYEPGVLQSADTVNGIRLMMSYLPAVGAILSMVLLWIYPLNENMMKSVEEALVMRKEINES